VTLEELWDRTVVVSAMRQERFTEAVKDRIWWVDPQNSVAQLYTRARQPVSDKLPIRILGTEGDGEWLWAWANPLNFPLPDSREYSNRLREHGAKLGIEELTTPRLPIEDSVNAETFASIALAMPGNAGYVLHRAGPITAAFLVGEPFLTPDPTDVVEIGQALADALTGGQRYENALDMIVGTFATLGLPHQAVGDIVMARDDVGGSITIGLEDGRLRCDIRKA
jgi:uncharacterized protein DUF6882